MLYFTYSIYLFFNKHRKTITSGIINKDGKNKSGGQIAFSYSAANLDQEKVNKTMIL